VAFLFAVILSGAASATTTTHISSDGKYISVTHEYLNSTLNTYDIIKKSNGNYGYGYYRTINVYGKDNQGRNVLKKACYFNGVPKTATYVLTSPGLYINESVNYIGTKVTATATGKISPTITFKSTVVCPYRYIGGQKCLGTGTTNTVFYQNGKMLAKAVETTNFTYKGFKGYYEYIKTTDILKTTYADGSTRKCILNSNYNRNSLGILKGLNVSGTSQGTQKINGKSVNYTGIINISTKYDPRDLLNEQYVLGDYKEVLTSNASKLLKVVPFESIFWN
jgi:hypothetical protein